MTSSAAFRCVQAWLPVVVRNISLYTPNSWKFLVPKTLQNSQILQPAERFSDVTGLCHHSVFGAKSAENGELRKVRFFVPGVESGAWASKFARFPPKTGSRRSPCSEIRFLPRKACEFQPAELVAACHRFVTTRFLGAKVRKTGPSPQGFSRPDSPPRPRLRWSVSPPSLSPLKSPLHPAPFLVQKALQTVESEESVFLCRTASGMPKPPDNHFAQFSAFGPEKRRIPARQACRSLGAWRGRARR